MRKEVVTLTGLPPMSNEVEGRRDVRDWYWMSLGLPGSWNDGPEARIISEAKGKGHGDYAITNSYFGSRRYTVVGAVQVPTWGEVQAAEDLIKSALSVGMGRLSVIIDGNVRYANVMRVSIPLTEVQISDRIITFEIEVYAPDPRKYAEQQSITIVL